jgi:putative transposase
VEDSYQGTPSGVPKTAQKEAALAAVVAIPSRHCRPTDVLASERTFFVTSSIFDKRNLLQSDRAAGLFIDVLYGYRSQDKYLLHEFVVMPDHFHALITLGREMTVERAMQLIKGGFAFRAGRELGFAAPVWQKGFSEVRTLTSEAFQRQCSYIRNNPVRQGLVTFPNDYLFSSASSQFELDPPPQRLKPRSLDALCGTPEGVP